MIFDHRTYTCRAGTIRKHLDIYLAHGFAAQTRHLGQPVLYAMTDVGDVNSYVHVWAYENAQDRSTRRAAMQADSDWQNYLRVSGEAGYLVSQVNKILVGLDLPKS
ncbi:MAG: NIPSNAP family protein [Oxalobacteraceae bacterium]|nr:MAG: NIPSNAP family protein [Oxalobacteraceae bacterium]